MNLVDDKVYLVTGGSRGLGKAIVLKLASMGAKVAFTFLSNREKADQVAEEVNHQGIGHATPFAIDAANPLASELLVSQVIEAYGTLHGVVNNAGILRDNPFFKMTNADWDLVMHTNLNSVFYLSREYLKYAVRQGGGKIVNMASVAGVRGLKGQANYCASKGGMLALTRSLAMEYARFNVQINAIAPGYIETEMFSDMDDGVKDKLRQTIPMKRLGHPEEIANMTAFMLSDACNYMTGQTILIDGGITV
jgi:3-oxoacyl-[acyl-carrier protein] reductase